MNPVRHAIDDREAAPPGPWGVWLTAGPARESIDTLLLEMLAPAQPGAGLREAIVEELGRPAKLTEVVLEYLGLRMVGVDAKGPCPLHLVAPKPGPDPWREALTLRGHGARVKKRHHTIAGPWI